MKHTVSTRIPRIGETMPVHHLLQITDTLLLFHKGQGIRRRLQGIQRILHRRLDIGNDMIRHLRQMALVFIQQGLIKIMDIER